MDDIIKKLIGENTTCDFKEFLERKQFKSWLKSVSAYANGIGGSLFFGVNDDGTFIQDRDLDDVSSKRRNPILVDVFAQLNYMEKRGSGLRKICNETSKLPGFTESKEPRFRSQASSFYTELPNNNYQQIKNDPVNDPVNSLTLLQKDLLEQMKQNREITRSELCERLNVSLATVRRTIAQLKKLKLLDRIGSDKSGHWVVTENVKGGKS